MVVSPLLSLMQDQTEKAEEAGVDVAKLDSTLTAREERRATRAVKKGAAELIYVTPERLENPKHLAVLKKGGVSLLVVDEAHCVSQWGHDFRPAYLALRKVIEQLGSPPVLMLTATATLEIERDVLEQLGLPGAPVYSTGIDRPNISFEVSRTVNDLMKFTRLVEIVNQTEGNGIVYVNTVKLANELHARLLQAGIRAGKYHGKMKHADREDSQHRFMADEYKVTVATKAFGLGIDKPDVRFVVHYTFPDSVESYYQEAGRAGRDGKKARAILLYRLEDKRVHSYFLGGKYPSRADAGHLYSILLQNTDGGRESISFDGLAEAVALPVRKVKVLLSYLEKQGIAKGRKQIRLIKTFSEAEDFEKFLHHYEERLVNDRERIDIIMKYGQTTECRPIFFRAYFNEAPGEVCERCDNCRTQAATRIPVISKSLPAVAAPRLVG